MPNEETYAAETTDVNTSEADNNADVGNENDGVNDASFSDNAGETPVEKNKSGKDSENAHRRREAERKAELEKARQTAREQAIIETLGGKNPYTGEDMKDSSDVQEFLLMREIEKEGGDPLSDYSKHLKVKEREKSQAKAKKDAEAEWYRNDKEAFASKYPDVDVNSLIENKRFNRYAEGKVGSVPLSEIYEGFIESESELRAEAEKTAYQKAQQQLANAKASPGSLSSTNQGDTVFFTREQVQKMSQAEVSRNYDKIRASMSKWS